MAKLTEDVQIFIVTALAWYKTPSDIVALVKDEFGLTVSRQQVETYNPGRRGRKPAPKWCELFEIERAKFNASRDHIAIAQPNWRLIELEDMARAAKKSKNYKLAGELLEQARQEVAGLLAVDANGRRGTGDADLSDDERIAAMRSQLRLMDDRTAPPPDPQPALPPSPTLRVVNE